MVARDPTQAGALIGTGFVWRLVTSFLVYGVVAAGCWALGYDSQFQMALLLVSILQLASRTYNPFIYFRF